MGIDRTASMAYLKSQVASGNKLPKSEKKSHESVNKSTENGNIFLSLRKEDLEAAIPYAKRLIELGFTLYCTRGTSTMLMDNGIPTNAIFKVADGRPNAIDLIEEGRLGWVVNTPSKGEKPASDEMKIRTRCLMHGISVTTTLHGLKRTVEGLEAVQKLQVMDVCSLQEYSRHSPKI